MNLIEVVLCNPVRMPIGTYNRGFKASPATILGTAAAIPPEKVEIVVIGQVIRAGIGASFPVVGNGMCILRWTSDKDYR